MLNRSAMGQSVPFGMDRGAGGKAENPSRPSFLLSFLLPKGFEAMELISPVRPDPLLPGTGTTAGIGASRRQREFMAGRLCARRAVARFGFQDCVIGVGADRRPLWPETLTGSITHTRNFTAAAVAEKRQFRAVGIDAEIVGGMANDIWSHVLVPAELRWLNGLPPAQRDQAATLMFSAKEAFYKCQYEVTGQWLEFKEIALELLGNSLDTGSFAVRPVGKIKLLERSNDSSVVRFVACDHLVITAMTIAVLP